MSSYHSSTELPVPDEDQIEHSSRLIERIVDRMEKAGGVIAFSEYMQMCLYEPGLGYYSAGSVKFGAAGDFVTAPEISPLFGRCLANEAANLFRQGLSPRILEIGAGSGRLCVDLLTRLNELEQSWQAYFILETSADLRQRQQVLLQQHLQPVELERIHWLDAWPDAFDGLVLGNEVLDAMPVQVLLKQQQWIELGVGFDGRRFDWKEYARAGDAVEQMRRIDHDDRLPDHYCTELNMNLEPWCQSLYQSCHRAVVLLIDYAYSRELYYHPQRSTGTLMCFYRHRTHPDPLIYPGLQDITAYVDFDALADAAAKAGFRIGGISPQAAFLMANGLLDLLHSDPAPDGSVAQLKLAQQVKTLTLPGEMGEKFKVIALHKDTDFDLLGIG